MTQSSRALKYLISERENNDRQKNVHIIGYYETQPTASKCVTAKGPPLSVPFTPLPHFFVRTAARMPQFLSWSVL